MQLLFASLLLTALYAVFLLNSTWGLGFFIINGAFILCVLFLRPDILKNKQAIFYLGASFLLSIFMVLRSFELGRFITVGTIFLLNSLAVRLDNKVKESLTLKELYKAPLTILSHVFLELGYWFAWIKHRIKNQNTTVITPLPRSSIVRGIIISLPIASLFLFLFAQADPLFEKYLLQLIPKNISIDVLLVKNICELGFFFGLFSSLFRAQAIRQEVTKQKPVTTQHELTVATIIIAVVIASFLLVQAQYLFANQDLLKTQGIMYSEYTRRGFFELIIVSAISLCLIAFFLRSKMTKTTKIIATIFILEVLLVLASASRRVYLYQDIHGFTQTRLLGILFSIWLTGVLSLFLTRLYKNLSENKLFFAIFIHTIGVIFLMHIINIDYTVAVTKPPNLGYGIDYPYIAHLSSDAAPGWENTLAAFETADPCSSIYRIDPALRDWQQKAVELNKKNETGWHNGGAFILSDTQALEFLKKNAVRIEQLQTKSLAEWRNCHLQQATPSSVPIR